LRALGIDPGTVSIDLCGVDDGCLCVDETVPTRDALGDPRAFIDRIADLGPFDCIAGPSGYGLPITTAAELGDDEIRLALLSPTGEGGGIGGLGALLRAIKESALPIMFTPGVLHLPTVPVYRKINRIDLGTADKVCAAALAIESQATQRQCGLSDTSLILLELGGAFTAAVAVEAGCIVDGIGGSVGPIGPRAGGALDSEVAILAGRITKSTVFGGGAADIRGDGLLDLDALARPATPRAAIAWDAYVEGACKAVAALLVAVPHPHEIVLSGRLARNPTVYAVLRDRLGQAAPVNHLQGFARVAKEAAQGAALVAEGLAGGPRAKLVDHMRLRHASGSVLDWLYVIDPANARKELGIGRPAVDGR
jgi:predicted butyrate kinase (DUF1464 family)